MHIYLTDITGVDTDHVLDKAYTEIVDIDTNTEEDLGPEAMTITDPDPGPDHTTTKGEIVQEIIDIDWHADQSELFVDKSFWIVFAESSSNLLDLIVRVF